MKIPSKNTCAHAISRAIHNAGGRRSPSEIVADLRERFKRDTIIDKISDMISAGLIARVGYELVLSRPMAKHFDDIDAALNPIRKRPTGSTATPRTVPEFRPLSNYRLPLDGMREGANDHRQYTSRQLP